MTTVPEYIALMKQRQIPVSRKLGSYVPSMPTEARVVLTLSDAMVAVLVKVLVDKGLITNAELGAVLDAAVAAVGYVPEDGNPSIPVPDEPVS